MLHQTVNDKSYTLNSTRYVLRATCYALQGTMQYNGWTTEALLGRLADRSPSQILAEIKDPSEAGHVFEAFCFGLIAAGCTRYGSVDMLDGTVNRECMLEPYPSLQRALQRPVKQGGSSGYSDVHFVCNKTLHLTTCKWIKVDSDIEDYEIHKLIAANSKNHLDDPYEGRHTYVVCCKDRKSFLEALRRAHSKRDMLRVESENVLDISDIDEAAVSFRRLLSLSGGNLQTALNLTAGRTPMKLKFHQRLAVLKMRILLLQDPERPILLAMKCRSGKSYIIAGHIVNRILANPTASFLIITPVPNETKSGIVNLFSAYAEFAGHQVVDLDSLQKVDELPEERAIIVASKQFLQKKSIEQLARLRFDTTYYDESHMGSTTDISQELLASYAPGHRVFVTATYRKPAHFFAIDNDRKLLWTMRDEELCKQNNLAALEEAHGPLVHEALQGDNLAEVYATCPRMKILSHFLQADQVRRLRGNPGFDRTMNMEDLFATDKSGAFQNDGRVDDFLDYVFGRETNDPCVQSRIYDISKGNHRKCPTQMWFLPYGSDATRISRVAAALEKKLVAHPIGKKYRIVPLTDNMRDADYFRQKGLSGYIEREEDIAKRDGNKGVIILSGNKGSTGVTLRKTDVVFLLSNEQVSDLLWQKMCRCMTEDKDKKYGIVVDFNPSRVLRSILLYSSASPYCAKKGIEEMFREVASVIEFADIYEMRTRDEIVKAISDLWAQDYHENYNYLHDVLEESIGDLQGWDDDWDRCLNYGSLRCSKGKKVIPGSERKYQVNSDDEQMAAAMAMGATLVDSEGEEKDTEEEATSSQGKNDKAEMLLRFQRELVPSVVHFTSIMTAEDPCCDMVALLRKIQADDEFRRVFDAQVQCWWGDAVRKPEMVLDICIDLFAKHIKNIAHIEESIAMNKRTYLGLLPEKKKALELVHSLLKPKEAEKKKFGEVFTPLDLVEQMLDRLPTEVWSDPHLRWFDPAVGCGNFMICVYYRLMEGLRSKIPDQKERDYHIVTKMLYMSEINPKNVLICRQMFGEGINIFEGDTLSFEPSREFGVAKFDVVVGNPPYNDASGNRGKGHTLWVAFVKKSLSEWLVDGGYLCIVHPALWRQVGQPLYKMLTNLQIMYLEIHGEQDGMRTFRCNTRYDWYVLRLVAYSAPTIVLDETSTEHLIDFREWSFLPNQMYAEIQRLMSPDEQGRCTIIKDRSAYGTDKEWVSKECSLTHPHPVIYSINRNHEPKLVYSRCINRGHFGIPKVIYAGGATGVHKDPGGSYGMSEWASGIVADPEEHDIIFNALESKTFRQLVKACAMSKAEINTKVLRLFRKAWWRDPIFMN